MADEGTNRVVLEAIARRCCVAATYNRMAVTLAPHILYTRHEDLFVDAVTVERDGRPPREVKLGTFKLAGLKSARTIAAPFREAPDFAPEDQRYAGQTLFVVGS